MLWSIDWLIDCSLARSIDWLIDCLIFLINLIDWLIDCLIGCLIDELIRLIDWLIDVWFSDLIDAFSSGNVLRAQHILASVHLDAASLINSIHENGVPILLKWVEFKYFPSDVSIVLTCFCESSVFFAEPCLKTKWKWFSFSSRTAPMQISPKIRFTKHASGEVKKWSS